MLCLERFQFSVVRAMRSTVALASQCTRPTAWIQDRCSLVRSTIPTRNYARALRAAGELGRGDLADALRRGPSDPEILCRFWAAWSLALSGTQYAAQIAYEAGRDDAVLSRGSLEIAMRAG